MQIEAISLRDLEAFARAHLATDATSTTPISLHRVRAWLRNPLAEPGDIVLIAALDGGRCIGYLGMLPGELRRGEARERIYWGSTYYVLPAHRDSGAGLRMISRWLKLKRSIVVTGASPLATQAVRGLRFKNLGHLPYFEADLGRFDLAALPFRALRKLARSRGVEHGAFDRLVDAARLTHKIPLHAALAASTSSALAGVRIRPVERLSADDDDALATLPAERFARPREVIYWMLADLWMTSDPAERTPGYYFDDARPLYRYIALEIEDRARAAYRGFVVFRLDRKHGNRILTLFDHAFLDPADARLLLPLAIRQARAVRADRITVPAACAPQIEKSAPARKLFARAERQYLYYPMKGSLLKESPGDIALALADGDIPFA